MKPPGLTRRLVAKLLPSAAREVVLGDLKEEFEGRARVQGRAAAQRWYRAMAWRSVRDCWSARSLLDRLSVTAPARRSRVGRLWDDAVQDVRVGLSGLQRHAGMTLLVTLTLTLAIGANTAVFSIANSTLLQKVPGVERPEDVVVIKLGLPSENTTGTSWPNIRDLKAGASTFESMTAFASGNFDYKPENGAPLQVRGQGVFTDFFQILGIKVSLGRLPGPGEFDPETASPVAVISERIWERVYGSDPATIGQTVVLNGVTHSIIGVLEDFQGTYLVSHPDVWFPIDTYARVRYGEDDTPDLLDRGWRPFFEIFGRLAAGADIETAEVQLRQIMAGIVEAYPEEAEIHREYVPRLHAGIGLPLHTRAARVRTMTQLGLIVGLVLVLACANVAGLLIARGVGRTGEIAVRRALGASQGRVVRQHLTESLLFAMPGAIGGLAIALGLTTLLSNLPGRPSLVREIPPIDGTVVLFTIAVAIGTALACGLLPAMIARKVDMGAALADASRRHSGGGSMRLRSALTITQISLSVVLLIGSTLMLRSLGSLTDVDVGFDPEHVSFFTVDPGHQGYDEAASDIFFEQVEARLEDEPAVEHIGTAALYPFGGGLFIANTRNPERSDGEGVEANQNWITPGVLEALSLRLVAGRGFHEAEMKVAPGEKATVTVINETLSAELFAGASPVGREIVQHTHMTPVPRTVVGVVQDARMRSLREPEPIMYLPREGWHNESGVIVVRSRLDHAETRDIVQDVVSGLNSGVPIGGEAPLAQLVREATATEQFFATLVTLMALLAATLAAVGLYGVIAYSVAQRTHELGVRIALGADPRGLLTSVLRRALALGASGIGAGVLGAVAFTRVLESYLFGVERLDPASFMAASTAFLAVTVLASLGPARLATRVDPIEALRI